MVERVALDAQNPWPGLEAYLEDEQAYFRGRDAEAEELARLVRRERLTVLFGRSGLGKSSLLAAGLFPRLRQDLHLPVVLRIGYSAEATPRQQVWQALERACQVGGVQAPPPEPEESLWAYFHRVDAGFWNARRHPVLPVLVFDQFEELFTLGQETEGSRHAARAFVDELADLIEDRPSEALCQALDADPALSQGIDYERRGCKVLISFREDFLADVEGLRAKMPSVTRNRFRLLPMRGDQARQVIASGGNLVGAGVADRIVGLAWQNKALAPTVNELDRVEVDPALLSVICSELNLRRRAAGANAIEPGMLDGAEREILVDFYERALKGLGSEVRCFVEDKLVSTSGYRANFAYEEAKVLPGLTSAALDGLVAGRLLRLDERFGQRQLELTHDVLTRVVMDSRERRRAREAELELESRNAAAAAAQRRNRRVFAAVMAGVVFALCLLSWAVWKTIQADEATKIASVVTEVANELREKAMASEADAIAAQASAAEAIARAASATTFADGETQRASRLLEDSKTQKRKADGLETIANVRRLLAGADRLPTGEFSRALLVNAEVLQSAPSSSEAQGSLLERLLKPNRPSALELSSNSKFNSVAFSPDGKRLALAGSDHVVILWDIESRKPLAILRGHTKSVTSVAFSADGEQLASASQDETIIVWDVEHGTKLARFTGDREAAFLAVAFSPYGKRLATAGSDHIVALWDIQSGEQVAKLRGHSDSVTSVAFSADGKKLASGSHDNAVIVWDVDSKKPLFKVHGHTNSVTGVAFSPDGKTLVSASEDKTLRLWDSVLGDPLARLQGHRGAVWSVGFSPDGRRLVSASEDLTLILWDAERYNALATLQGHRGAVLSVAFSSDGKRVASVSQDKTVLVWDVEDPKPLTMLKGHTKPVLGVAFSPNSRLLASASEDETVIVWDVDSRKPIATLDGRRGPILSVAFSQDGKQLAFSNWDESVIVWDIERLKQMATLQGIGGRVLRIAFGQDGNRLVLARDDDVLIVVDIDGHKPMISIGRGRSKGYSVELSRDGKRMASLTHDRTAVVREVKDGRLLVKVEAHQAYKIALSPDGKLGASIHQDNALTLWDAEMGKILATFETRRADISSVAFSSDGKLLALASKDNTLQLWDIERRQPLATLEAHGTSIGSLEFSPDRKLLAAVDDGRNVMLWDLDPKRLVEYACQSANRNLSCDEWRYSIGADVQYRKTCSALPSPGETCR